MAISETLYGADGLRRGLALLVLAWVGCLGTVHAATCTRPAEMRQIALGAAATVDVPLPAGTDDWLVETDEHDIDATASLLDADGSEILAVDAAPTPRAWQFLVARQAPRSARTLRLVGADRGVSGTVEVRISCLSAQSPARIAVLEALAQAASKMEYGERRGVSDAERREHREAALAAIRAQAGAIERLGDPTLRAWATHNTGYLLNRLDRLEESLQPLRAAAHAWQAAGQPTRARLAWFYVAKSEIGLGHYTAALGVLEPLIEQARQHDERYLEGIARNDTCLAQRYLGHYAAAERCYGVALERMGAIRGSNSWVNSSINLARVQSLRGHPAQALRTLERTCAEAASNDPNTVRCEHARGSLDLAEGRLDDALVELERALAAARRLGDTWWEGTILLTLADARRANGELASATAALTAAASRFDERNLPERAASTWVALANLEEERGDLDAASAHRRRALAIYDATRYAVAAADTRLELASDALTRDDPDEARRLLAEVQDYGSMPAPLAVHDALVRAQLALAEERPTESLEHLDRVRAHLKQVPIWLTAQADLLRARTLASLGFRDKALATLDEGIAFNLRLAGRIRTPLLRRAVAGRTRQLVENWIEIAFGDGTAAITPAHLDGALARIDAVRAPLWSGFRNLGEVPNDEANHNRHEYLLQWINQAAAAHVLAQSEIAEVPGMRAPDSLDDALLELDRIDAQGARTRDVPVRMLDAADVASLRARLSPDSAILTYLLTPQRGYRFVATREGVEASVLPGRDALTAPIRALREALVDGGRPLAELRALGNDVRTRLWPALAGIRHVDLVADGLIEQLPLDALPDGDGWLGDRIAINHPPTLLGSGQGRDTPLPAAPRIALFGDPILGESARDRLPALPATRRELDAVAAAWPGLPADRYLGVALDGQALRFALRDRYDLVHVASHAIADARRPELGGVMVSRTDGKGTGPGMVGWRDLLSRPADAGLVVLSACDTGTGVDSSSEGSLSLARALLYAGVRRVVASRWPVDDAASSAFIGHFYTALAAGQAPSEALTTAAATLRATRRYAAPRYWAAYFLLDAGTDAEQNRISEAR